MEGIRSASEDKRRRPLPNSGKLPAQAKERLEWATRPMGGQLKIEAVFPEGKVEINQFRKLKKAAGAD
jgi:hypothetical protein